MGCNGMRKAWAAHCLQSLGSGGFTLHPESSLETSLEGQACAGLASCYPHEIVWLKTCPPQLMGKTKKLGRE